MWEKLNHNIDKMLMLTKNLLLAVEKQHQKLLNNDKIGFDEIIKEQIGQEQKVLNQYNIYKRKKQDIFLYL